MRRRTVLLGAVAALTGCTAEPDRTLRIAAGEPGGFYVEFARLLAARLEPAGEVLETGGSVRNLELVRQGTADLGLALADVAADTRLRAIGRVYENYMQLVVPAESPVRTVADLAGARISLGAQGSGAAVFGDRLLTASGVVAAVDHRSLTEAVAELAAGRLDALLWSGGVPTPALADLDGRRPIRLVDLSEQLGALRDTYGPVYQRVPVPDGGYGHPGPVATIGVANLLVADAALPAEVAASVARTLVHEAPRLVPPSALGTQYLDLRSLITTGDLPLHPGAATAYRELRD
jgi:uncharacterized protein